MSDLTLGYIERDGVEATDEALIFVGNDNDHTIHVKCPHAKIVAREIVQDASRIRGLKGELADSEERCLKAGNRIEELVAALTAADRLAEAFDMLLDSDVIRRAPFNDPTKIECRAALAEWRKAKGTS